MSVKESVSYIQISLETLALIFSFYVRCLFKITSPIDSQNELKLEGLTSFYNICVYELYQNNIQLSPSARVCIFNTTRPRSHCT